MDGLVNVTGSQEIPLTVAGKDYTLAPMLLNDYAEREAYILRKRPHALDILKSLPDDVTPELREQITNQAIRKLGMAHFAAPEEVQEFEDSLHGVIWNLSRALRKFHPELATFDGAMQIVTAANKDENRRIILALEGVQEKDILPNSSSPAPEQAAPGAECRGPDSSEPSPSVTDGQPEKSAA